MSAPNDATLGSVYFLSDVYKRCESLCSDCKLTNTFGKDLDLVQIRLDTHQSRLRMTACLKIGELKLLLKPEDIYDKQHHLESTIVRALSAIEQQFTTVNKLLKHYQLAGMF